MATSTPRLTRWGIRFTRTDLARVPRFPHLGDRVTTACGRRQGRPTKLPPSPPSPRNLMDQGQGHVQPAFPPLARGPCLSLGANFVRLRHRCARPSRRFHRQLVHVLKVLMGRTEVNSRKRLSLARSTSAAERPAAAVTEGLEGRGEPFGGFDVDADDLEHRCLPVEGEEVSNLPEERPRRTCRCILPENSLSQRLAGVEQGRLLTPARRVGQERPEVSKERSDQRVHGSPFPGRSIPSGCRLNRCIPQSEALTPTADGKGPEYEALAE